jgi:hypothetical protein
MTRNDLLAVGHRRTGFGQMKICTKMRYDRLVDFKGALPSALLLVVGAAVGFIPTYLIERRKERHALAVRWDTALYELCKDFSATVREFVHLVRRYGSSVDKEQHRARVDEHHAHLRGLAQQIRLLGSKDLQQAAREVEHHAWWVREVCEGREDKLAEYYENVPPETRLRAAMHQLYVATRAQLGVSKPEDVAPDEPIDPRRQTS